MSLNYKAVTIIEVVPSHSHRPGEQCMPSCTGQEWSCSQGPTYIEYTVNLETGECTADSSSEIVLIDKEWFDRHCAEVGRRVLERFNSPP